MVDSRLFEETTEVGGDQRVYDGNEKVRDRRWHLLVDNEGFERRAEVHSAKVLAREGLSRYCIGHRSHSLAYGIRGWTRATEERTRAGTGSRRPWDGAWISSSARASPPEEVLKSWTKEWAKEE